MTGDVRKLLGGYATGTLTDAEQKALFEAALADQELFNALGDEQALRDYLEDREFRGELLEALEPGGFDARGLQPGYVTIAPLSPAPSSPAPSSPAPSSPAPSSPAPSSPAPRARRNWQPFGWVFSGAVAVATLTVFFMALHPSRLQITENRPPAYKPPPPLPPANAKRVLVAPMDAPPPLPRTSAPDSALSALARMQPSAAPLTVKGLRGSPPMSGSVSPTTSGFRRSAQGFDPGDDALSLRVRRLETIGKVTDVNAAIVTVDVGTRAGINNGDRLTISRGGQKIGTLTVTTASEAFSVGRYTGAEPKAGDRATLP